MTAIILDDPAIDREPTEQEQLDFIKDRFAKRIFSTKITQELSIKLSEELATRCYIHDMMLIPTDTDTRSYDNEYMSCPPFAAKEK